MLLFYYTVHISRSSFFHDKSPDVLTGMLSLFRCHTAVHFLHVFYQDSQNNISYQERLYSFGIYDTNPFLRAIRYLSSFILPFFSCPLFSHSLGYPRKRLTSHLCPLLGRKIVCMLMPFAVNDPIPANMQFRLNDIRWNQLGQSFKPQACTFSFRMAILIRLYDLIRFSIPG